MTEKPFEEISDETFAEAMKLVDSCEKVIDAGVTVGKTNSRIAELIEKAKNEVMDASVEEIMYIEAAKHQIIYHTEDEAIVSKGSMAKIVKELWEYGFIRVHVAYVVNIRYIKQIGKKELILRDETVLPISGSYKEETMKNYKMLLERIRYGESR